MKYYVIKNKEGKYFCGFDGFAGVNIFSERIIDGLNTQTPTLKHCKEEIKDYNLRDCKPVEVTIAEGDLQHQLAEKDREIKQYQERAIIDMNYKEMLELQLDKADKEIEKQKDQVEILKHKLSEKMETQLLGVAKDKIREIRCQVCEEIRKKINEAYLKEPIISSKDGDIVYACLGMKSVKDILDQIEKGK